MPESQSTRSPARSPENKNSGNLASLATFERSNNHLQIQIQVRFSPFEKLGRYQGAHGMIHPQTSPSFQTALTLGSALLFAALPICAISAEFQAPQPAPVSFVNEVVPILTKLGCNGGTCHGKATGQNGFKLSLFGFEPDEDYEHLVYEQRGRRLTPSAPEESLLITKGAASVPHGGGRRLEPGTAPQTTMATT